MRTNTIGQLASSHAPPATDAASKEQAALATLSATGNHTGTHPSPPADGPECHVLPLARADAYHAAVVSEFQPGCGQHGQIRLRVKITARG